MPSSRPGWVYVMTCPGLPSGCCKIGGTAWSPAVRAVQLVTEYRTGPAAFTVEAQAAAADWQAAEAAAHRMLWDRHQFREVFRVSPAEAGEVIRAAARSVEQPSLFRRLAAAPSRVTRSPRHSRRRRGTNWLPVLLLLSIAAGVVSMIKPDAPAWLPLPIARTLYLVERL